jgi:hypothetical protein
MSSDTARSFSAKRGVAVAACVLIICLGGVLFSMRAYAAFIPVPSSGNGILRVDSDPYPAQFGAIAPGESTQLQVRVNLDGASTGSLSMQLRGGGPLVERASGLNVAVESCPQEFVGMSPHLSCATGAHSVLDAAPLASVATSTSSSSWTLQDIVRGDARFLLVTLSMPADAAASGSIAGSPGSFGIGLYAAGDEQVPGSADQPPLAETGLDLAGPLLIALGTLGLGLVIRARRRSLGAPGHAQVGDDA